MYNNDNNTEYYKNEILNCNDLDELRKRVLNNLTNQENMWKDKINDILNDFPGSDTKFSTLCGVSKMTVSKWRKGAVPRNRETFLRIGLVADYSVNEINNLLNRYGNYPGLYSKNITDCICIYSINNYSGEEKIQKFNEIYDNIKGLVSNDHSFSDGPETTVFDEKLSNVRDLNSLELFVKENASVFATEYNRFNAYVKMLIQENYIYNENNESNLAVSKSINEMAIAQGWSSSLITCVSEINQGKCFPERNMIISLGIHLSLTHEQIDNMLVLAHMEPLFSKNIFESVIMYILDSALNNNKLDIQSDYFDPDDLLIYANSVLNELNIEEVNCFISELSGIGDE